MMKKNGSFAHTFKSPKAVIFDTDNTLYPYTPAHKEATRAVEEKVVKILGVKRIEFTQVYNEARKEIKERLGSVASSHSRLLYIQSAIEKLGLGTRILLTLDLEQTYWRTFLNNCRLFPGVVDFIYLLKSKGIVTANITDLTAQIQFRKLIYFGLDELFDYVVTSEEAGRDKPDDLAFQMIIQKLNIPVSDIWMIGDSTNCDVIGTKNAGMVACKMNGYDLEEKVDKIVVADIEFNNYKELMGFYSEL